MEDEHPMTRQRRLERERRRNTEKAPSLGSVLLQTVGAFGVIWLLIQAPLATLAFIGVGILVAVLFAPDV